MSRAWKSSRVPSQQDTPLRHRAARCWAPRRRSWWIAVLFIIGSTCFAIGPFPGFVQLVGASADAAVFFAGSLFFTAAAALQCVDTLKTGGSRLDRWAAGVQFA